MDLFEAVERSPEHRPFERKDNVVPDPVAGPRGFEALPLFAGHRGFTELVELGYLREVDKKRIQPERAPGRIGGRIAGQGRQKREEHEHPLPRRLHPAEQRGETPKIANAEVRPGSQRKQGKKSAREATWHEHVPNLHQRSFAVNSTSEGRRIDNILY